MKKTERQASKFTDAQRTDKTDANSFLRLCVVLIVFRDKTRQEWWQERGISPQTLSVTLKSHRRWQNPSQHQVSCGHMTYILTILYSELSFWSSLWQQKSSTVGHKPRSNTQLTEELHGNRKPADISDFVLLFLLLFCRTPRWNVHQSSRLLQFGFNEATIERVDLFSPPIVKIVNLLKWSQTREIKMLEVCS